jgi:3-methyladenine DNA glycosylase AlkD
VSGSVSVTVDVEALAEAIDAELRAAGGPERAEKEKSYLKSELHHYATSVPAIRAVARAISRHHPELDHDQVVALVGTLWSEPVHERRVASVELLGLFCDRLGPGDAALLERLVRESRTWALADGLATSVVGRMVERHPELGTVLDRWSADQDLWLRRSAMLALLIPLRRGGGDFERFGRYADAMLEDREPLVRKAIGWVLRETGRTRPDLVHEWLLPRAARASGVTIREAVKPLTPEQRTAILATR